MRTWCNTLAQWSWLRVIYSFIRQKKKMFACSRPTDPLVRPDCKRFFFFFLIFFIKIQNCIILNRCWKLPAKYCAPSHRQLRVLQFTGPNTSFTNIHEYHFRGRKYRCKNGGRYGYNRLYPTSSTACTLIAALCWSVTTVKIMRPQLEQI